MVQLDPLNAVAHHALGLTLQELGKHEEAIGEFEWLIRSLDPKRQLTAAELRDGDAPKYLGARHLLVESLLCVGRFADAQAAAQHALDLPQVGPTGHAELRRYLDLCDQLRPLESRLPALLAGKEFPEDPATVGALAGWCCTHRRLPLAAVRLYDVVFTRQPALADDLESKHRFHAACAAALGGCGSGEDAAKLDDRAKAALRKRALEWLRADVDAWVKRSNNARGGDAMMDAQRLWEMAAVQGTCRCPRPGRTCQTARGGTQSLAAALGRCQGTGVARPRRTPELARAHIDQKQWGKAAEVYAQLIKDGHVKDSEVWFEYAAVQLLSGDRKGYRQTCKWMLEGGRFNKVRHYLVARACTLAPGAVENVSLLEQVSAQELQQFATAFWSLTEQGALRYRANQFKKAVPLLERSLQAEARPGAAVLNWLWLAMTYQKLGKPDEARRWLDKASAWLDALGGELPANADALYLHRHNWLEAQILRREAELLRIPPTK